MISVYIVDNIVFLNWIKNIVDYLGFYMFILVRYFWIDLRIFDFLSVFSIWLFCFWCFWFSFFWFVFVWSLTRSSENSWLSLVGIFLVTRFVLLFRLFFIVADLRIRIGVNIFFVKVWVLGLLVFFILGGIVIVNVENFIFCIDLILILKRRLVGIIKS